MFAFPIFLTIYAGFVHAFEADHLLAVSTIVSHRNNIRSSLKDGIFWGLGHASTIFVVGIIMILFKVVISPQYFHYFEATVGLILIALATSRLLKFLRDKKVAIDAYSRMGYETQHKHVHVHIGNAKKEQHKHSLAYGVGLIHGLAGSGALILIVMSQVKGPVDGLIYLLTFGFGCIGGMMLASGLFSVPFSRRIMQVPVLQNGLIISSSALCLLYGSKVIYQNIMA